ncbi:hypothetical protein ANCCEY_12324 [Ancylostoma ceylanicum]|uniref:Uncharacterized protein n=1 Tax=Ancylostoma ceylanicum TaxID=53326 RepID=A0A0D6L9H3_9BILA|nr:hypothetical protein ANCCEY_12324 [Ancylostoma ceylanicum]
MDNITTFLPELAKSRWLAPVLLNSSLAVDSFLFISGAVAAFTVRKRILFRENDKFSFFRIVYRLFMFYFHRLSRLWPALLMTTLFVRYVYNHLGDGPMWSTQGLLTGWTVSVRNEKQPSTGICLLLKIVAVSLLYFALFAPFCKEGLRSYIHAVLHRTTWSVALAILVWLCENGLAPEISFLLSSHRLLLFSSINVKPNISEIPILSMERKLLKTADRGYEEDHPSGNEPDWRKERSSVEEEPNYHEKATAWLRTPEFNEASAPPFQEFHAPNFQEDRLPASGIPTAMECASTFSMDSFFWCGKEGHQEDWSREPSLIDKFDREAEERLLPKRPIDLEQWEKSLFSTC